MSWPRRELRNRVGAVLGALITAALIASCGSSSSTTSTAGSQTAAIPTTSTGSTQKAGTGAATGTSATQTAKSTTTSKAPPPAASVQVRPAPGGHLLHRYTGHGNKRLGTIVLHGRSLLVWYTRHPGIQIFTSSGFMLVKSGAPSGTVRLSRGTYRGVRVASAANWSVELRSATS